MFVNNNSLYNTEFDILETTLKHLSVFLNSIAEIYDGMDVL